MNKLIFIACLFSMLNVFSQNSKIDSLLISLPESQGKERIEILHSLIKANWTTKPSLAVKYGREAIALSENLGDIRLQSISYRLFGGLYNYMSLIDSGRYYKSKALALALESKDPLLLPPTYNNLGVTSQTVGNYVEALNYYYMAYLTGKELPEFKYLPTILANISEVYYDLAEYDSAVKYARKSLSLIRNQPPTSTLLLAKIDLAKAKMAIGEYEEAASLFNSIIKTGIDIEQKRYVAYAYQGLGRLNHELDELDHSKQFYTKGFEIFSELGDQAYLAEILLDIGKLNMKINQDSALAYCRKSLAIAKKIELTDIILLNYKVFIDLYGELVNIDSFRYYYSAFNELETIRKKKNNFHSIGGMFAKIQEEETKRKLSKQSIELEQEKIQTKFFIAIALITLLGIVLIYIFYRMQKKLGNYLSMANDKMSVQNDIINKKNRELNALNYEKNDLIQIVAHDLKNPLANIINSVQLVTRSGELNDQNQQFLDIIEGSSYRLMEMISKILNVEAIEKGLTNLDLREVDISEMLKTICKDFEAQVEKKQIALKSNISNKVKVSAEATYLHQVIENLISNAVKFSPRDSTISINLTTHNKMAKIEIKDEGPGISKKDQTLMFQMYQKLSAEPTGDEHSSGLGLSIVKKYVDAMNGQIWCKSKVGIGTSFYLRFQLFKNSTA